MKLQSTTVLFKSIVFILLCWQSKTCFAQTNSNDFTKVSEILPPSPHSASLGKYGGIDIGLASGMANISIPLFTYNSKNISIPVSLSYSSNGFKVDEIASRVGTSWTINVGGVITRTVYGTADEQVTNRLVPPSDFPDHTQNLINFADALTNH